MFRCKPFVFINSACKDVHHNLTIISLHQFALFSVIPNAIYSDSSSAWPSFNKPLGAVFHKATCLYATRNAYNLHPCTGALSIIAWNGALIWDLLPSPGEKHADVSLGMEPSLLFNTISAAITRESLMCGAEKANAFSSWKPLCGACYETYAFEFEAPKQAASLNYLFASRLSRLLESILAPCSPSNAFRV